MGRYSYEKCKSMVSNIFVALTGVTAVFWMLWFFRAQRNNNVVIQDAFLPWLVCGAGILILVFLSTLILLAYAVPLVLHALENRDNNKAETPVATVDHAPLFLFISRVVNINLFFGEIGIALLCAAFTTWIGLTVSVVERLVLFGAVFIGLTFIEVAINRRIMPLRYKDEK